MPIIVSRVHDFLADDRALEHLILTVALEALANRAVTVEKR